MQAMYHWLWRLLPGNPLTVRIVLGGSRRARHLWVRMGYLGVLIALVIVGLLGGGAMAGQVALNDLAKAGATLFAVVAVGQVVLVCLLAPLFMAGALTAEQSGKTYDILLTTPLSNLQIVLGSLGGRLFFVLALLASGLPLFAVLTVFGGVPNTAVFVAFAVAGLTAAMMGAVAVAISVLRAAGRRAVYVFIVATAAYLAVAYAADRFLLRDGQHSTWLTPLHPLLVLEATLNTANYRPPLPEQLSGYPSGVAWYLSRPFAAFAALTGISATVLVLAGAVVLRWVGSSGGVAGGRSWLRRVLGGGDGGERVRPARAVWDNPIAWREAATRGRRGVSGLARWAFVVASIAAAVVLVVLYHQGGLWTPLNPMTARPRGQVEVFRGSLLVLLLGQVAVLTLVALYVAAGSVSREREDGTLDLILTTPITPPRYIWGKLRGLVSFLALLLAAPAGTLAVVSVYQVLGEALQWPQVRVGYATAAGSVVDALALVEAPLLAVLMLVPFTALCVMAGMTFSVSSRGVLPAVTGAVVGIGSWVAFSGFCGLTAAQRVPLVGAALNALSPTTGLVMVLNPWENVAGFVEAPLGGRVGLLLAVLAAGGFYALLVYAMLQRLVSQFDLSVRRLSGERT